MDYVYSNKAAHATWGCETVDNLAWENVGSSSDPTDHMAVRAVFKQHPEEGWKAQKSATMSPKSDEVDLEVNFRLYNESEVRIEASRGYQYQGLLARQVDPSDLRRRERRAADPAIQQRAAENAASAAAGDALAPNTASAKQALAAASLTVTSVREEARVKESEAASHLLVTPPYVPTSPTCHPAPTLPIVLSPHPAPPSPYSLFINPRSTSSQAVAILRISSNVNMRACLATCF